MKRDISAAVAAAVRGLYIGDQETMEDCLHEILSALDTKMADLYEDNPDAAYAQASSHDLEEDDIEVIDAEEELYSDDDSSED
jgi:hypothetical protein